MYFRLTTLKIPPQMSFHQHFFCNFVSLWAPPMILLTAGTLTDPAARESFTCVQGWVAAAGWHREGGINRVASAGWHRPGGIGRVTPQTKILATPVLSYKFLMKSPYSLHLLFLMFIDPLLYRSPLPSPSLPPSSATSYLSNSPSSSFPISALFFFFFSTSPLIPLFPLLVIPVLVVFFILSPFSSFCAMWLCLTIIIHG